MNDLEDVTERFHEVNCTVYNADEAVEMTFRFDVFGVPHHFVMEHLERNRWTFAIHESEPDGEPVWTDTYDIPQDDVEAEHAIGYGLYRFFRDYAGHFDGTPDIHPPIYGMDVTPNRPD